MKDLKKIFNTANKIFLSKEIDLIKSNVSERCLCASLKSYIEHELINTETYKNYYVDTEYNRNAGRIKTIIDGELEVIKITCDLIVHSRGENQDKDNLIAVEIKKSYRSKEEKDADRKRLIALTKSTSTNEVWSYDEKTFPKHVCGYFLGIYYEIDISKQLAIIEYYVEGKLVERYYEKLKNIGEKVGCKF